MRITAGVPPQPLADVFGGGIIWPGMLPDWTAAAPANKSMGVMHRCVALWHNSLVRHNAVHASVAHDRRAIQMTISPHII